MLDFIEKEIQDVVKIQEELGLDVFVHGEPERNDMVRVYYSMDAARSANSS